jgi:hypothetical protein
VEWLSYCGWSIGCSDSCREEKTSWVALGRGTQAENIAAWNEECEFLADCENGEPVENNAAVCNAYTLTTLRAMRATR